MQLARTGGCVFFDTSSLDSLITATPRRAIVPKLHDSNFRELVCDNLTQKTTNAHRFLV
jgi:hypothetical protein